MQSRIWMQYVHFMHRVKKLAKRNMMRVEKYTSMKNTFSERVPCDFAYLIGFDINLGLLHINICYWKHKTIIAELITLHVPENISFYTSFNTHRIKIVTRGHAGWVTP
jgi:hypothetical protein